MEYSSRSKAGKLRKWCYNERVLGGSEVRNLALSFFYSVELCIK